MATRAKTNAAMPAKRLGDRWLASGTKSAAANANEPTVKAPVPADERSVAMKITPTALSSEPSAHAAADTIVATRAPCR